MKQHFDAEVVAGWAEGTLDPQARAAAEAHAADCTQCQAVLAAMVRTDPAPSRPVAGWLSGRVRWILPLATAATAVLLWVGLGREARAPVPTPVASRVESPKEAIDRGAPSTAMPVAPGRPAPAAKRIEPGTKQGPADVASGVPRATASRESIQQPAAVAETVATIDELRRNAPADRPAAQSADTATVVSGPPSPAAAPAQPELAARRAEFRAASGTTALLPGDREYATPDRATRWRIGAGGAIHRSTDAGKTWMAQASGATADLLAASAPSNGVCWIVGRSGVVLLSTDGATWRRLSFPETADLRAVDATDARTATVTTIDGRTFRTTDGGATWQR